MVINYVALGSSSLKQLSGETATQDKVTWPVECKASTRSTVNIFWSTVLGAPGSWILLFTFSFCILDSGVLFCGSPVAWGK